jgi:hsp70-interacting protein
MLLLTALIRNNKAGVTAFRLANGYAGLKDALCSESTRFQRFFLFFLVFPGFMLSEYCVEDCVLLMDIRISGKL